MRAPGVFTSVTYQILAEVPDITTISLTATPPFDVTGGEWRKYVEALRAGR